MKGLKFEEKETINEIFEIVEDKNSSPDAKFMGVLNCIRKFKEGDTNE